MADSLVDELKSALGDAYTIERELMGGGMSRVFVAREHALGREVVIKVLLPELAAGVNRERFRREIQLAARLSHPYIVPLLHAGEDGSLLWFTMPFISGESLRARLQREGPLKVTETLRLLRDVVEALAYAHSRGVIHRDIKPANILSDGQHALVTDFGVAKALNAALPAGGPGHTTSGMAIGTPAYMAPEQLAADPDADQRVDIYAVGLLAYELLTGVSPFAAASPTATMTAQLTRIPEPLHQKLPDVPEAFSTLVQHCLAKSPDDRPPDAQAVLLELDRINGAIAADAHRSVSGERTASTRASAVPLVFATVGVLALVAAGFWWTGRHGAATVVSHDTSSVRAAGDTAEVQAVPHVLNHQDSLSIAEALRDQLNQLDPKAKTRVDTVRIDDTVPLNVQVARTDSLIRARMSAMYSQLPLPTAVTGTAMPAVPTPPGANTINLGSTPTHHLGILVAGDRDADSTTRALLHAAGNELARQANLFNAWAGVTVDTLGPRRPGQGPPASGSDVLVFLSMQRVDGDSNRLRISVRSADPRTGYAGDVLTSEPAFKPTSAQQFGRTVRDASRLLLRLSRVAPGASWPTNMNQVGRSSGPFDPGFRPRKRDSI